MLTEGGDEHGGVAEPADGHDAQGARPTDVGVEPTSGTDKDTDAVTWGRSCGRGARSAPGGSRAETGAKVS